MKKLIISIILLISILVCSAFVFAGCNKNADPESVAKEYIKAYQNCDVDAMMELYNTDGMTDTEILVKRKLVEAKFETINLAKSLGTEVSFEAKYEGYKMTLATSDTEVGKVTYTLTSSGTYELLGKTYDLSTMDALNGEKSDILTFEKINDKWYLKF